MYNYKCLNTSLVFRFNIISINCKQHNTSGEVEQNGVTCITQRSQSMWGTAYGPDLHFHLCNKHRGCQLLKLICHYCILRSYSKMRIMMIITRATIRVLPRQVSNKDRTSSISRPHHLSTQFSLPLFPQIHFFVMDKKDSFRLSKNFRKQCCERHQKVWNPNFGCLIK